MKKIFSILLFPRWAMACPFCDYGGNQTAQFILVFFGLMSIGAALIFFAYLKSGGMKDERDFVSNTVLQSEGILTKGEVDAVK